MNRELKTFLARHKVADPDAVDFRSRHGAIAPEGIICRRHMRGAFAKIVKANKRVDSAPR